jgi:hypothetical protein
MPTLTFLPWKTIDKPVDVGLYCLVPYTLGSDKNYDQVLSNFHNQTGKVIKSATIVLIKGQDPIQDLTQEQVNAMLEFGEIIATSFLCNRGLFSHFKYTNYHSLRTVVQRFNPASLGIAVNARRRDGEMLIGLNDEMAINKADYHIEIEDQIEIDGKFCQALVEYSARDDRPLLESIFLYLHANTDSSDVMLHSELVLICGAIESVLNIKNGNTTDLVAAFLNAVEKVLLLDAEIKDSDKFKEAAATKTHQKALSIREVWIKDFYITRGDIAHGRKIPQYASQWSMQEHVILASEIFPLLLKLKLQDLGVYAMTEDDLEKLFLFDHRISHKSIMKTGEEHHMPVFGWYKAVEDQRMNWIWKKDDLIIGTKI